MPKIDDGNAPNPGQGGGGKVNAAGAGRSLPKLVNRGAAGLLRSLTDGEREGIKQHLAARDQGADEAAPDVKAVRQAGYRIAPDLLPFAVPTDSLTYDPENARIHPERNMDSIKESLTRYGQQKLIVARREDRVVMAGNGTLAAARELGWEQIACRFTDLDDVQAQGFGLADNRTAELADWDIDTLARLNALQAIAGENPIGWSEDEMLVLRLSLAERDKTEVKVYDPIFTNEQIAKAAFDYFRSTGFPYPWEPPHMMMQDMNILVRSPMEVLLNTKTGMRIADTYHPDRYHVQCDDFRSPMETYTSDKWFMAVLLRLLELGGSIGKVFSGAMGILRRGGLCSNFRPGYALTIYRRFCPEGGTVLDTSTGYGGRLVGFLASQAARYIGIDPNIKTHENNLRMVADMGGTNRVELHNVPVEDFDPMPIEGQCDLAFTSPPYFGKEQYSYDPTQSFMRYKTGKDWREGFLIPMLTVQWRSLRKGGWNLINIQDVNLKGKTHPLVEWTKEAAVSLGFLYERTEKYPMARALGANRENEEGSEPVLVFQKPR